jgi:hypothetical protein
MLVLMADDPTVKEPRPVRRRFTQLIDAFEQVNARYAICGAIAMGAHGARRFTEDIDVLIGAEHLEAVVTALSGSMRELARGPEEGPTKQVKLRAKRARTYKAVDVDLMVPMNAIEHWALDTGVRVRAFDRKVDVVSTEALVAMKLAAYLSDPESREGGKHRIDAMTLLETTKVDLPTLRRFVRPRRELAAELERVLAAPPPRGR